MTSNPSKAEDITSDLLLAVLAVNSWSLERVGALYEGLRANGLFDVSVMSDLTTEEIEGRLNVAGYKRGPVLGAMMALRVHNIALSLAEGGAQHLADLEAADDVQAARQYLFSLKGVGPAVVENYFLLRSSARS
jgi:hypothetical protein